MELFIDCLLGPRLFSIYYKRLYYEPNSFELLSYKILQTLTFFKHISIYASPFLILYIQRNELYRKENFHSYFKFSIVCFSAFLFGNILKGFGRLFNLNYIEFLQNYKSVRDKNGKKKEFLRRYDFDMNFWESDYEITKKPKSLYVSENYFGKFSVCQRYYLNLLSFFATHLFALKMAYPGHTMLLNCLFANSLIEGRFNLITRFKAQRAKIKTYNNLDIDTIFIDKRQQNTCNSGIPSLDLVNENVQSKSPKSIGNFLLITCEGNASFYETGCANAFINTGLSILGWNHPGFASSTGKPYPENEIASIDAVVQYAIEELKFQEENILFYSWSIGCFTASWASMRYSKNTALVLDAAFDDILPLAINRMPTLIESLVTYTVRRYLDLRTVQYLINNPSPNIIFIRRTEDEIMNIKEGDLSSNRINDVALKTFQSRYPYLFTPYVMKIMKDVLNDRLVFVNDLLAYQQHPDDGDEDDYDYKPETDNEKYDTSDTLIGCNGTNEVGVDDFEMLLPTVNEEDKLGIGFVTPKNTQTLLPLNFPFKLGKAMSKDEKLSTALDIIKNHFYDFDGSHCDPLPKYFFVDIISRFWK